VDWLGEHPRPKPLGGSECCGQCKQHSAMAIQIEIEIDFLLRDEEKIAFKSPDDERIVLVRKEISAKLHFSNRLPMPKPAASVVPSFE
jgi:hypothetical protein